MQLGQPPTIGPPATDVATALAGARQRLGHRPAVTVLSPRGREEQGVASLAQWAAKGAHLLELDYQVRAGDRLLLDAPLSWTSAAVCLAAWWAGLEVATDGGDVEVAVVHESRDAPAGVAAVLWLGDAIDGGPVDPAPGEPWVRAVQTFPDQPPPPRVGGSAAAARVGERGWTQTDLVTLAGQLGEGTLGLDAAATEPVTGIVAVALRPLVVGRPTVVLQGVGRDTAQGERVATWL